MYNNKKILAIIPARGGSKGLPRKNIKPLAGKPLIAWTIEQAQKSSTLDRVFISTDSDEIAYIARQYSADIPFLRPGEFALDESPTSEAVIHALTSFAELGESYDYVALLEPTSPLRRPDDIDLAVKMLVDTEGSDGLISVGEIHTEHPMIVKKITQHGFVEPYIGNIKSIYQRQQADKAYFPYGVVYISKVPLYYSEKSFYSGKVIPFLIERWQNYEIDDQLDLDLVEKIIELKAEVLNG